MANNFEEILSNWQFVLPPSRPSIYELERVKSYLLNVNKNERIAVLGSTIEYRNLLHTMGFKDIYIFEKNPSFYNWTQGWIVEKSPNEKIVWGDWLDTIKNYREQFAVVLSDLTMGNIPYEKRFAFYQDIYFALKSGGVFLDKVLTHDIPHLSLSGLMMQYDNMPINLETINRFSCEVLFCSDLLNNEIIDTTKFYNILAEEYTSPVLNKFIEMAHLITPENCIWYYGKAWRELSTDYNSMYSDITVFDDFPLSPYYGRCKHFFNVK